MAGRGRWSRTGVARSIVAATLALTALAPSAAVAAKPDVDSGAGQAITALSAKEPDLYRNEKGGGLLDDLSTFVTRQILPAIPGALLLLFFSALFSAINFYNEIPREERSVGRTWRYLLPWLATNYTFAMILLVLMLPSDVSLSHLSNQLFVYCLAVSALPELSANVRLQLGKSNGRALDLYKYKNKLGDMIAQQMRLTSQREQTRERECLESFYAESLPLFRAKLVAFFRQGDLSEHEQEMLIQRIEASPAATSDVLVALAAPRPAAMRRLLSFFRDDIERFRTAPIATLMGDLHPPITLTQARKLVAQGITSRRGFVLRTIFGFQRRRLAQRTGFEDDVLNILHFSTRRATRRRRGNQLKLVAVAAALALLILNIVAFKASTRIPTYEPERLFTAEQMSVPEVTPAPPGLDVRPGP